MPVVAILTLEVIGGVDVYERISGLTLHCASPARADAPVGDDE
jgi:hypothetical protein